MKFAIIVGIIFSVFGVNAKEFTKDDLKNVPPDPDVGLDCPQIVQKRGYQIETHYVTTADGYILTMFRIPRGKNAKVRGDTLGSPVILQHGLLDSSYAWVCNYEDQSLAYILADSGFDVWLGNNRGNRYGRNHTTLNPDDKSSGFWDITWDDMASQDVPAMVNYVIDNTGYASLGWVGHSEGTIQMFAAGTSLESNTDPNFQRALKSINVFAALAPVAYVSNITSKLLVWLAGTDIPENLYNKGMVEFLPYGPIEQVAPEICQHAEYGCDLFLMSVCGPTRNVNVSRIQVYVSETPAGTSTMNLMHWQQGVLQPKFQKYDYGSAEANQAHYKSDTPPQYDLGKMAVPTGLFYGKHDYLADMSDVQKILDEMPKDKIVFTSYLDNYAHLDYTWAYNANEYVYPHVKNLLTQYADKTKNNK